MKSKTVNEIYAHSVKQQLSDYMGIIFEKLCRDYASVFEKTEIIIIIFSQKGINGWLI